MGRTILSFLHTNLCRIMSITDNKKPKGILKHNYSITNISSNSEDDLSANTTNNTNTTANQSWFSKLNSMNESSNPSTPIISPRINNLFNFKKQNPSLSQEEQIFNVELTPREIRRVRFPVAEMTTEHLFKKDDILLETKKQDKLEPINIQTSGQLLSLYETNCRKKQEPTIDLFIATLTVNSKLKTRICSLLNK